MQLSGRSTWACFLSAVVGADSSDGKSFEEALKAAYYPTIESLKMLEDKLNIRETL